VLLLFLFKYKYLIHSRMALTSLNLLRIAVRQAREVGRRGRRDYSHSVPGIVFSQQKIVGYSCKQMFGVVSDVESYSQFIPYCRRSVITLRGPNNLSANLMIGFKPLLNIKYTSHITMVEPYLVTAVCKDMNIFDHLKVAWKFSPYPCDSSNSCLIDFAVSFSFKSTSHSFLSRMILDTIVQQNVNAFVSRAELMFGPPNSVT